jgi:hypothetical protein
MNYEGETETDLHRKKGIIKRNIQKRVCNETQRGIKKQTLIQRNNERKNKGERVKDREIMNEKTNKTGIHKS